MLEGGAQINDNNKKKKVFALILIVPMFYIRLEGSVLTRWVTEMDRSERKKETLCSNHLLGPLSASESRAFHTAVPERINLFN